MTCPAPHRFGSSYTALLVFAALLGGCASSYRAPASAEAPHGVTAEPAPADGEAQKLSNHYVLGLLGESRTDVRDMCASGIATRISIRTTWFTTLITVATLGLYSPLEERFTCAPKIPEEP